MSEYLKPIVEALIFASPEPITRRTLNKLLDGEPREDIEAALAAVRTDYDAPGSADRRGRGRFSGHHASRTARMGPQAVPRADDLEAVGAVARDARGDRLQQPVTAPEIAEIRGVSSSSGVLQTLIERKLVKTVAQAGRRPSVHVRHDARIPRALRPQRHRRFAEGGRTVRCARLRAASRTRRAGPDHLAASVRRRGSVEPAPVEEALAEDTERVH